MPFAITQTCCNDASCVSVCPVNCIHPTPDEPDFGTTDMLYIDPDTCIDCGACADACPVDAIYPVDVLSGPATAFAELNRAYFAAAPADNSWGAPRFPRSLPEPVAAPRVAVVGTGPAAGYTVQELLRSTNAEITVIDRMPVPGGLLRFGVAPDHPSTKQIGHGFASSFRHPRVRVRLGVEVGTDVTAEDLAEHHHAVFYAIGAAGTRTLGIPGETLPGSVPATRFVAWCNGSPEVPGDAFDLATERVVVVGNGNVALDVARLLLTDPDTLADTPIASRALAALRSSKVREVVLLGRRGPEQAAYTRGELLALRESPEVDLVVDAHGTAAEEIACAAGDSHAGLLRSLPTQRVDWELPPPDGRRLVLRFRSSAAAVLGDQCARGVRVSDAVREPGLRDIPAGLVVRSIGSVGVPLPGLPFDEDTGVIPNEKGRVNAGTYVVGWAKRGARGGIGANRACAAETVGAFLDDATAGRLRPPRGKTKVLDRLVRTARARVSP